MQSQSRLLAISAAIFLGTANLAVVAAEPATARPKLPAKPAPKVAARAQPATTPAPSLPAMPAQQVAERYLAARGGAAWKSVNTLVFRGKLGAGGTTYEAVTKKLALERKEREEMQLPFVLEAKRPNKARWEITFNGQTAVQVFDGAAGFKYRPFLNRPEWDPYTDNELKMAKAEPGMDGWLATAVAEGAKLESDGTDWVDKQACYRLKVTRKNSPPRHVWIDSKSFLEAKEDGAPRMLDGRPHDVSVALQDYRAEQGLMIPHVIATVVKGVPKPEQMTIESVSVNPALDDARFAKPR